MNNQIAFKRTAMAAALREIHPEYFGDPFRYYDSISEGAFSGPAYGERLKKGGLLRSVVSVGLAIATNGMSLGFSTAAQALSTVGFIAGVAGAVTGNKALGNLGMLASLGGGFMSLSSNGTFGKGLQDWATETNSVFKGLTGQQSTAQSLSNAASSGGADVVTAGSGTIGQTDPTSVVSGGSVPVDAAAGDLNLQNADIATAGNELKTATTSPVATEGAGTGLIDTAWKAPDYSLSGMVGETGSGLKVTAGDVAKFGAGSDVPSLWDNLANYSNKYGKLIELGGHGVKFVGDLLKEDDVAARKKALEAQAGLYAERTATEQAQMANASAVPDITSAFRINNTNPHRNTPAVAAGVRPAGLIQTRAS